MLQISEIVKKTEEWYAATATYPLNGRKIP